VSFADQSFERQLLGLPTPDDGPSPIIRLRIIAEGERSRGERMEAKIYTIHTLLIESEMRRLGFNYTHKRIIL
jgi:hypothetical protein